jgi:hypothetical protein
MIGKNFQDSIHIEMLGGHAEVNESRLRGRPAFAWRSFQRPFFASRRWV